MVVFKPTFFIFLISIVTPILHGQNVIPEKQINSFFDYLYNYSFNKADSSLQRINVKYPDCVMKDFLNANYYWYLIISGEQHETIYEKYNHHLDKAIYKLKKIPDAKMSKDLIFEAMLVYAYKARMEVFKKEYVNGLYYLQYCLNYLKLSIGKEKEFEKYRLTSGLYHYFMRLALDSYPVLYPYYFLLPPAHKEEGLVLLNACLNSENAILRTEACYFLMKINLETEKKPAASVLYSKTLIERYPHNLVYRHHYFEALLAQNKQQAADYLSVCRTIAESNKELSVIQKRHLIAIMEKQLEGKSSAINP